MDYKILIIGTVPYNEKYTSRAFASYFGGMDKENLHQIFSNPEEPLKRHCSSLYQMTDARMLKRFFDRKIKVGKIYNYDELKEEAPKTPMTGTGSIISYLYKIGKSKTPFIYLMRHVLWKKKHWCTAELDAWLDKFNPDCVFLSFSDDFFIPEIALYAAEKFNVPIISSIGDDYYFNNRFSISPFYYIYRVKYKKLIEKVFKHGGGAIYIGNKIRDKYNSEFGLDGVTVYLTSEIEDRGFKPINKENPQINYFGNIGGGRNESLCDIAEALEKVNPNFKINVYSNEKRKKFYGCFEKHSNIVFHGSVPYKEVVEKMRKSDILLIVEGFKEKNIFMTRYSLSTKVADSLSSGAAIFGYGSRECGAIEYLKEIDCTAVCTDKSEIGDLMNKLVNSEEYQKDNYEKAKRIIEKNHKKESSLSIFKTYAAEVVNRWKK